MQKRRSSGASKTRGRKRRKQDPSIEQPPQPQLQSQSQEIPTQEKKIRASKLPPEVWYLICHMAGHREKLSASLTCKLFRDFVMKSIRCNTINCNFFSTNTLQRWRLEFLGRNCPHLTRLTICKALDVDELIKAIPPSIRWLRIERSKYLTEIGLRNLPVGLRGLYVDVGADFYQTLGPVTKLPTTLTHLTLADPDAESNRCLNARILNSLPRGLKSLEFIGIGCASFYFFYSDQSVIASFSSLTSLTLTALPKRLGEAHLPKLPDNLRRLIVHSCRMDSTNFFTQIPSSVTILKLTNLPKEFNLDRGRIFPRGLTVLRLGSLNETSQCTVSNRSLQHLPDSLQKLILWGPSVITYGFTYLPAGLRVLKLVGDTIVKDESLKHIPHTVHLILKNCTAITDEGLASLQASFYRITIKGTGPGLTPLGVSMLSALRDDVNITVTPTKELK